MTEYTPTIDEVRECFMPYLVRLLPDPDQSLNISNAEYGRLSDAALARFFDAHDAEVAANAWDEGFARFEAAWGQSNTDPYEHLSDSDNPYRADRIEREATNHKPTPELGSSEGSDR